MKEVPIKSLKPSKTAQKWRYTATEEKNVKYLKKNFKKIALKA